LELRRAPCDLEEVVREQVAALRVANPLRVVRLDTATEGRVQVEVDADRIGQVVANYVSNALKYSPEDRLVTVRVAVEGGWARVAVVDRGPGLPAHEQERVWGRYYRAEGVRVQSGSAVGLGLGLHICKIIVEGHGGQVGIASRVGQGSTFWFTLPLADGTAGRRDERG
jgi:signal transduction histidine kinase